jgi:hypothetical protein
MKPTFKPNRPVRIGKKMYVTDAKGCLPKGVNPAETPNDPVIEGPEPAVKDEPTAPAAEPAPEAPAEAPEDKPADPAPAEPTQSIMVSIDEEAKKLEKDNTAAELKKMAKDANVALESDDNKLDIARKIVAFKRVA